MSLSVLSDEVAIPHRGERRVSYVSHNHTLLIADLQPRVPTQVHDPVPMHIQLAECQRASTLGRRSPRSSSTHSEIDNVLLRHDVGVGAPETQNLLLARLFIGS